MWKVWKVFPAKHQHADGPLTSYVRVSEDRQTWSYPLDAARNVLLNFRKYTLEEVVSTDLSVVQRKCDELNRLAEKGERFEVRECLVD